MHTEITRMLLVIRATKMLFLIFLLEVELVHIVICAGKLILENTGYFYWSCNFIVCQSMQPSTLSYSTDLEDSEMITKWFQSLLPLICSLQG